MADICIICLETCETPIKLQLRCECKYIVHHKCFNKWWLIKHNCIICKKRCKKQSDGRCEEINAQNIVATLIERYHHRRIIRNRQRRIISQEDNELNRPQNSYINNPLINRTIFTEYYLQRQQNMEDCSKFIQILFYCLLLVFLRWLTI